MKGLITNYSKTSVIIILFAIVLVFNLVLFPLFFSFENESSPLDLRFSYSAKEAYEVIENFGHEGRAQYRCGLIVLDFIYPVFYSFMLCFLLFLYYKKYHLSLMPFFIMAADFLENTGIILMLHNYPEKIFLLATLTSVFTSFKWIFTGVCLLLIVIGLGISLYIWANKLLKSVR